MLLTLSDWVVDVVGLRMLLGIVVVGLHCCCGCCRIVLLFDCGWCCIELLLGWVANVVRLSCR